MRINHPIKWTSDLAYAIGLIVTDGCLSSDGRHIIFTSQDLDLINTFRNILDLSNKIGITSNNISRAYRVQFGDVIFYKWLLDIGIFPNKSLRIGAIKVPNDFFMDFLRGHLDGDGSITTYTDNYNTYKDSHYIYERLWLRFISGSYAHLYWLHSKITGITGIQGRLHLAKPNSVGNQLCILKYGKKDSILLLNKIYYRKDLPCLVRKRRIAEAFLVNHELQIQH